MDHHGAGGGDDVGVVGVNVWWSRVKALKMDLVTWAWGPGCIFHYFPIFQFLEYFF